jgi:hypothetical protein
VRGSLLSEFGRERGHANVDIAALHRSNGLHAAGRNIASTMTLMELSGFPRVIPLAIIRSLHRGPSHDAAGVILVTGRLHALHF